MFKGQFVRRHGMSESREIEEFRRMLKGPEKKKFGTNWHQWIGSPTAWLALMLSVSTAFYTFLYHSDELSVVIDTPDISVGEVWDTEDGRQEVSSSFPVGDKRPPIVVTSPRGVAFINSGTRPIAVTSVWFALVRPDASGPALCKKERAVEQNFDFEQIVIKPYDVAYRKLKLSSGTLRTYPASGTNARSGVIIGYEIKLWALRKIAPSPDLCESDA
jgi:hypothetical protein